MKIKRIKITNFKTIGSLDENLNGSNVFLLGDNEQGKSTVLEAIQAAFGDTSLAYEDSIKWGELVGNVQVYTDSDGNQYRFEVKMKKGRERPIIEVTYPDGKKSNKISTIGSLVGEIKFDAEKFVELASTNAGRRKQVDIVKGFLPDEVQEALKTYENRIEEHYGKRTEINRDIKYYQSKLEKNDIDTDFMSKYAVKKDVAALQEKLDDAVIQNSEYEKVFKATEELLIEQDNVFNGKRIELYKIDNEIEKLEAKIAALKEEKVKFAADCDLQYKHIAEEITNNQKWLDDYVPVDEETIKKEILEASDFNSNVVKVEDFREILKHKTMLEDKANDLTAIIELSKQEIENTIRTIDLPVKGLKFDDEQLYWNDVPVNPQTLSTSQIMELGILMKMSLNPNAKVVLVERAESLGKKKLEGLLDVAKKYGWQLIMEKVDSNYEGLTIQLI